MITKSQFERYIKVQQSGRTNMFDVKMVEILSGLTREQILEIMKSYSILNKQYYI